MIGIVVAYAKNRVIGVNNDLPWYIPEDLRHFKEITSGHAVIMGRKTFESIVGRLGKPLPNRRNIVITSNSSKVYDGAFAAPSLEKALAMIKDENAYIIGGASVFEASLKMRIVDKIYATEIDAVPTGDVFFPEFDMAEWREVSRQKHTSEKKPYYVFDFVEYARQS
jgi:dihydrofolate reductase